MEHTGALTETQEMLGKEKGSDVVCQAAVQHHFWQAKAKILCYKFLSTGLAQAGSLSSRGLQENAPVTQLWVFRAFVC